MQAQDSTPPAVTTEQAVLHLITAQLKQARRDRRLTQQALADGLGVAVLAIGSWESGVDTPQLDHFVRWAETLGFTATVTGAPAGVVPVPGRDEPLDQLRIRCLIAPLRATREKANWSQPMIAEALHVSSWSVHMWETHHRVPRLLRLIAWCHALGCDLTLQSGRHS